MLALASPYRPATGIDSWPSPPPLRGDACANAVGVFNDAVEFALWLSPHIDGTLRDAMRRAIRSD